MTSSNSCELRGTVSQPSSQSRGQPCRHEPDEYCNSNTVSSMVERLLELLLYRFRWIFVIGFILPLSVVYDLLSTARNWLVYKLQTAPKAHDRKVAAIQRQIREWNKSGRKQKLCTARAGHQTMNFRYPKYKNQMLGIRTDRLIDILELDTKHGTIRVEPMVTMGQLTRFLIPLGYTLPVVPELDDLTVGGLINGCGIESTGIQYGLFQHTCASFEVVTANGELVIASKNGRTEHRALYFGLPWSHGTLGFLVAATLRIIPCKSYVRLAYTPCQSLKVSCKCDGVMSICQKLRDASARLDNQFVECLMYDRQRACLMTGRFADRPYRDGQLNAIGRWYKPWFFKHVEKIQRAGKEVVEYIPLRDYYHRHSRSIFWEIQEIIPFGNNFFFRYLLGWASPPKVSLLKRTMPRPVKNIYDRHHVLQDLLVPAATLETTVEFLDQSVEVYPLWLCPFNLPSQPGLLRNRSGVPQLYVDVGVYGTCTRSGYDPRETTRAVEKHVRGVNGAQLLYADCYQSCAEFWEMFDATLYDWLRAKYDCRTAFPSVYEKVCRAARD